MRAILPRRSSSVFPLRQSADGRYFLNAQGAPRPIKGRTSWLIVSLTQSAYQSYIDDTVSRGYNTIEMMLCYRWQVTQVTSAPTAPFANGGTLLPFLKRLDGSSWDGTFGGSDPDFTTPNPTYWDFVAGLISYCESKGVLVLAFPSYVGYNLTTQGWGTEVVSNGQARMQTYGAWLANRFVTYKNIMWMLAGDKGSGIHQFNSSELSAQLGQSAGLKSVTQPFRFCGAELEGSEDLGYSYGPQATNIGGTGDLSAEITVYGLYSWVGQTGQGMRAVDQESTHRPQWWMEGAYEGEEPTTGNGYNPNVTLPTRRYSWNAILNGAVGGVTTGHGNLWPFGSTYSSSLNTRGTQDLTVLWHMIDSIDLHRLVPTGLRGIGSLITAGAGTIDTTNYVSVAATLSGDLLLAYRGPGHSGSFTIDLSKMRGGITARWYDPTNGQYQSAGTFSNSGTQAFTAPGTNSVGETDWVLRLDA